MITTHLLQMLFLPMLLSFIPVAFATSSCPKQMLEIRLNDTDFPSLLRSVNITESIPYTLVYHCRAHNFTEPTWVTSVILALTFTNVNDSYFALLYYECNSSNSFNPPTTLISVTAINFSANQVYLKNNSNADFCHNCVNESSINFCESCNSTCNTTATDDLDFCYGPGMNQCCNYIQDNSCASQCNDTSYPDENSVCTLCVMECGSNKTLNYTGCECVCSLGYLGDQCDTHICDQNPCNNGGNCSAIGTQAQLNTSCACPLGYNGTYCDIIGDPCVFDPCNNGTCTMINSTSYNCTCDSGFIGSDCLYPDPCGSNLCNNGTCTMINSTSYNCTCDSGFIGSDCLYPDPCNSDPCNNGMCTMTNSTSYNCTCYTGFIGSDCLYADPCFNASQCNYNGMCKTIQTIPFFQCNCTQNVTGDKCQYNRLCSNITEPCQNNGRCTIIGADEYNCTCVSDYTGDQCQTSAVSDTPTAVIAIVLIILIIIIAVIIIILVVVLLYYFYVKPKKGMVEISKKTSKVHPTNGDNGAVDEKAPILEKHKH